MAIGPLAQASGIEDICGDPLANLFIGVCDGLDSQELNEFSFLFYGTRYNGTQVSKEIILNREGATSFERFIMPTINNADLSHNTSQSRPTVPMIAALWDDISPSSGRESGIFWEVKGHPGELRSPPGRAVE